MTNPKQKRWAAVLAVVCVGLFVWNFYHPHQENQEKENNEPTDEELLEQYKDNSLNTGAVPYSTLYGYNSTDGDATFEFNAPPTSDVIITIKDTSDVVVRHAYIKKNEKLEIKIPHGYYQIFFIYGNSWCPVKTAPNGQNGFFLEDLSVNKDSGITINYGEVITYTLYTTFGGNFSPDKSNANEAL